MEHEAKNIPGSFLPANSKIPSMVIHGSAVNTEKGALVFLGKSGAGKSSIVELLSRDSDFSFIADDVVSISRVDRIWQIQNGVNHLSESFTSKVIQNHDGVRVAGFMLLNQAKLASSIRITQTQFAIRIMNAILEIVGHGIRYNSCKALRWFCHAGNIAESIPCWNLNFPLSQHTISHISSVMGL